MLTTGHIRRKLFQIVLLLCGFAFFVAFLTDLALQDRLAHLTSQSNITDRWLKGEITKSDDPELKNIWKSLCVGLARADTYFRNPGAIVPKARLLEPSKGTSPDTSFPLPSAPEQPRRVYVDFNYGAYYKFNPADFISGVNGAPGAAAPNYGPIHALAVAREDDLERYEKVLYDFVAAVNRANIDNKGDTVEIATRKYSDSMLEFFGVKDIVSKRLPNLTVSNVFAASSNGTLAILPWNSLNLPELPGWDFKKREWYKSAFEDAPSTEWIQIENKPDQKSFGLAGFYVDAVSGDYIRTLWHKIVVPGNSGPITYVMCVDLNLGTLRPQTVSIITLPSRFPNAESLIEAAVYGLEFSLATLVIGALIILPLSMLRPQALSSLLVHRRTKEWETEEYFTPVSQAFATRGNIMLTTGKKSEKGVEQKISFSAWFSTQIVKISFDKSKNAKNVKYDDIKEDVILDTIDKDPFTRGYEMWRVFRSKWRSEGNCRVCGQEVQYKEDDVSIAEPIIRHRRSQNPSVDLRLDRKSDIKDTKSLEDTIIWHATDVEPKNPEKEEEYELTLPPKPRVPELVQNLSFFENHLKNYQLLTQSRIDVQDCVELSKELFTNRNVRAVCHIDYFHKIIIGGERSAGALTQGTNIERVLIADKTEDMKRFIKEYRSELEKLLNPKNQELFTLNLEKTGVEFDSLSKQHFDLDFAVVYDGDFRLVLVSNLSEINKDSNVRGYLSWRKVDAIFFETIFDRFKDYRSPLKIEDLQFKP